jgi:phage major head subunit gpT-like protein
VLVLPELANDANTWYMADTTKPIKPLIFQPRVSPEIIARFNPQDPAVFNLDRYTWGVRARYEGSYTLPYLASRVAST